MSAAARNAAAPVGQAQLNGRLPADRVKLFKDTVKWRGLRTGDGLLHAINAYLDEAEAEETMLRHPVTGELVRKPAGQPYPEYPKRR